MPKIVDKSAKRQKILDAALRVFAQKGFSYAKMIDIAGAAGIGKGTIYEYFKSKNEILHAAYLAYMQLWRGEVDSILQSNRSPLEKIRAVLNAIIRLYSADPERMRVFFDFWIEGSQNPSATLDFKALYRDFRGFAQSLLDQAVVAGEVRGDIPPNTAFILVSVIEGTFLQWLIDPGSADLPVVAREIFEVLIQGIRQPLGRS